MKNQIFCCCVAITLWTAPVVSAQSKWNVPDNMKQLTGYIKSPVFADVKDQPGLPRVLIIGDSISMYYTPEVRRLLAGKANVYRVPDNGKSTMYCLKNVEDWLGDGNWAVIHFNFGLHDIVVMPTGKHQVPIEDYGNNLRQLIKRFRATNAKLIWAATTPVPEGSSNRNEEDVLAFNAAAKKIMDESGIPIDDLYGLVVANQKRETMNWPNNVHFRAEASADLADEVTKHILAALGK
jgi:GDSL-like lipase/acylhydrolase family protein